jgi:hypothetical protein
MKHATLVTSTNTDRVAAGAGYAVHHLPYC